MRILCETCITYVYVCIERRRAHVRVSVCEREREREEEGTIILLWPIFPFPSKMVVCINYCVSLFVCMRTEVYVCMYI